MGNKSDLTGSRVITYQQGEELSRDLDMKFFETSAKVNYSVEEAFIALAMIIKESCGTPPTPTPPHSPAASPALAYAGRHASGTTRAADAAPLSQGASDAGFQPLSEHAGSTPNRDVLRIRV